MEDNKKLQTLWDERNRKSGAGSVWQMLARWIAPILGLLVASIGGWLYWNSIDLLNGPGVAPIGSVVVWPSSQPVPSGWRVCDGSTVQTEDASPKLWGALQGLYKNEDRLSESGGEVRLPNFEGKFLRGHLRDLSNPIGEAQSGAVGRHTHLLEADVLGKFGNDRVQGSIPTTDSPAGRPAREHLPPKGAFTTDSGEKTEDETRPENYAVKWIIRIR